MFWMWKIWCIFVAVPSSEEIQALCEMAEATGCLEDCHKGCGVCGALCNSDNTTIIALFVRFLLSIMCVRLFFQTHLGVFFIQWIHWHQAESPSQKLCIASELDWSVCCISLYMFSQVVPHFFLSPTLSRNLWWNSLDSIPDYFGTFTSLVNLFAHPFSLL